MRADSTWPMKTNRTGKEADTSPPVKPLKHGGEQLITPHEAVRLLESRVYSEALGQKTEEHSRSRHWFTDSRQDWQDLRQTTSKWGLAAVAPLQNYQVKVRTLFLGAEEKHFFLCRENVKQNTKTKKVKTRPTTEKKSGEKK